MRANFVVSETSHSPLSEKMIVFRILDPHGVFPIFRSSVFHMRALPHHTTTTQQYTKQTEKHDKLYTCNMILISTDFTRAGNYII